MRYNSELLACTDGRYFVFVGSFSPTCTRRFGFSVLPDGSFGLAVLAISSDFSSGFECYQLDNPDCEVDFLEVTHQWQCDCRFTEAIYSLPVPLCKFGAFKFGKKPSARSFVKVLKPVEIWEDSSCEC